MESKTLTAEQMGATSPDGVILLPPAEEPDFVIIPKEGQIVRKGYYKGRSYAAGHKMPYSTDFRDTYSSFSKKVFQFDQKGERIDFERYFKTLSFADYNNPQYLNDICHSIGEEIPPQLIAPLTTMLKPGEFYKRFVKVESGWYALVVASKAEPLRDGRVIYLSGGGYAICSGDLESLKVGRVPQTCYLIECKHNPTGFVDLDLSYYDGTHEDFLNTYYQTALTKLEDLRATLLKYCPDFAFKAGYDKKEVQQAYENGRAEAQKRFGN